MTSGKNSVLFRADGNAEIGLGHIHRCISLAEILAGEFNCIFAIRVALPGIRKLISDYNFDLIELDAEVGYEIEARELGLLNCEIIVLDGYRFDTQYQQQIVNSGKILVCIDDIYAYHFLAHAVINPAGNTTPAMYSAEPYSRFFLGSGFCLIKKPFRDMAISRSALEERENAVFVCIGGADTSRNDTLRILKVCEKSGLGNWHYYVVLGEAYPFKKSIAEFMHQTSLTITLLANLSPEDVAFYMNRCKAAICPPSGLAYEYLCIGGILYLFQVAENQSSTLAYLVNNNLAFLFSEFPVDDYDRIKTVFKNQNTEFDGQSDTRLLEIFRDLLNTTYTIRPARASDAVTLFQWANDTDVRDNSIHQTKILWEDHVNWYDNKLKNPTSFIYVLEGNQRPVGQIRFELHEGVYLIDYSIDSKFRGKGLGKEIVKQGIDALTQQLPGPLVLRAEVLKSNPASISVFEAQRFSETGQNEIGQRVFITFEKTI